MVFNNCIEPCSPKIIRYHMYILMTLVTFVLVYLSTHLFNGTWEFTVLLPGNFSRADNPDVVITGDNKSVISEIDKKNIDLVVTGEKIIVTLSPEKTTPITSTTSITKQNGKNGSLARGDPRGQLYLDNILAGHWSPRNHTAQELDEIEVFIQRTHVYHKFPAAIQREDNKCGNVNVVGPGMERYRAVCDHKGATPCCMNNVCANETVQGCRCPECYDLRQQIHAELSTWVPDDPSVKMTQFSTEKDVCDLLQNKTIYFVGDSFIRQIYTSLLAILRKHRPQHVFKEDVSKENFAKCDNYYRYFAECRYYLVYNTSECNGTVQLNMEGWYLVNHLDNYLSLMKQLIGKPDSWYILGIGYHNNLDAGLVIQRVLEPLFKVLSNSEWPKMVWMSMHSPGLLKSPHQTKEQTPNALRFNAQMKAVMAARGIPILNYFQLTKGTMSYDGSHYGKGVNDAKLQIILNYFNYLHARND